MTRIVALVLAAALTSAHSRAQSARAPRDSDERTLLRLEDSWASALVRRDGATFRRLLADGFVYSENDRTSTRDEVLRDLVGGPDTVTAAHNEDMRVHRFGSTAVVTGWLIVRGHGPGGPFDRRYRFTDTWARRNGQWQIVAAHDYLPPVGSPGR
jgi:ketosteroid isomerase-like protein